MAVSGWLSEVVAVRSAIKILTKFLLTYLLTVSK